MKKLFTSESVGKGHPDKICDQISDAILDVYLAKDKYSRVAIEVMVSGHYLIIAGEVSSKVKVDVVKIATDILDKVGYLSHDLHIVVDIKKQSSDIAIGVDLDGQIGAGDQGIMFGYATNETPEYMPLAIVIAHKIVKRAENLRLKGAFKWAKADMKSQVTLDYSDVNHTIVDSIVFSCHHDANYNKKEFKDFIKEEILKVVLDEYNLKLPNNIYINPTGAFIIGGPIADTGLTGRKIVVDTYGGASRIGGGAFYKDPTKVDRSAAYMCRYIAKNIVAAKLADKLEIQVSYAIGKPKPTSIMIETFNTHKIPLSHIEDIINKVFSLSVGDIIKELDLLRPIYLQTATFGHFGRDDLDLPWEKLDKVEIIKKLAQTYE